MTIAEQMAEKRAAYDKLSAEIEKLEAGALRQELKKRRNSLSGEIVRLRVDLINAGIAEYDSTGKIPERVPREVFAKDPRPE